MATKIKEIKLNDIHKSKWPLVIGYFGSIHVMHCQLFEKFHHFNVLTFKDFNPKTKTQLYAFNERIKNIARFRPQNIFIYDLSKDNMKAEEFVQRVLLPIKPNSIVVGTNFKFGSDHKPYSILNKYFKVDSVNHNARVSTTLISQMLSNKQVEKANNFLYQPYHYTSQWIKGQKRGTTLGFKTINLKVDHRLAVCEGSYVARIKLGRKWLKAVAFVGASKTFKMNIPTIEVHAFNKRLLPRSLYPQSIRNKMQVEFLKYIRENTKYKSSKLLVKAIERDIKTAKAYFERNK